MIHCTMYIVQLRQPMSYENPLIENIKNEDVGVNKFVVGQFLKFKMVDSKTVINQVQEIKVILHKIEGKSSMLKQSKHD